MLIDGTSIMTNADEIDLFFADRTVQGAIEASRESRPLQICYPREIPVTRFLAWLFDPTQGHGLGGGPIRRLLTAFWENGGTDYITNGTKIAPANLATQSFADAVIQREVAFDDRSRLDILILLPQQKMLIAIENKYGAREAELQLGRYRANLEQRFEGWDRVLVLLDWYAAQPTDDWWIGLDYEWLIGELKIAERSSWLGDESRRSIRDFRTVIEGDADDTLPGVPEASLVDMVRTHSGVFRQMEAWEHSGKSPSELVLSAFADQSDGAEALQKLLPVYVQRSDFWRQCTAMVAYAELRSEAQKEFADLAWDPKRSAYYFALEAWNRFMDEDAGYWPLSVMVREQFDVPKERTFVVISHLYTQYVKAEYMNRMLKGAAAMRTLRMKQRPIREGMRRPTLRVNYCETKAEAAKLLCSHLHDLTQHFSQL